MTAGDAPRTAPADPGGRGFALRWLRATSLGWLIGIPLIVALALLGEGVGIGGAQTLVGAGMGAGVGLMQGLVMRGILPGWTPWFWSCVAGLGLPFLVTDIAKAIGRELPYSLYPAIALGGLAAGAWQALLLRRRSRGAGWWVGASLLGWGLSAGAAWVADALTRTRAVPGIWGALAFLGIVAGGGVILGTVTGIPLAWLLGRGSREGGGHVDAR